MSSYGKFGGGGRNWSWGGKKRSRSKSKSPGRKSQYVTKRQLPAMVMKTVNKKAEMHHFFHEFKSAVADYDGDVYHLSNIPDGVLDKERLGENVMVAGIEMSGFFNNDDTDEAVVARVIIFRANEAVSSTPTPAQVLATVGDIRAPVSLYNVDNTRIGQPGSNRATPAFSIFYDQVIAIGDQGSTISKVPFKANIKLSKPLPAQWIGAAATDTGPGQWYLLYLSSAASAVTSCQMNADARIYWTDV